MNKFEEELDHIDWRNVLLTDDLEVSCGSFIGTINKIKEKFTKTFKKRQEDGTALEASEKGKTPLEAGDEMGTAAAQELETAAAQ